MNRFIGVGRLTKDPELKVTQANISFVNFTLAINRPFKNESGESEADFINCIVWRKSAENLAQYQVKGNLIGVEGRLQTRTYESESGTRYIVEVVADNVEYLSTKDKQEAEVEEEPFIAGDMPF